MTYIEPLKSSELADLQPILDGTEKFLGFIPNDVLTMARYPEATARFMQFCLTLYENATLPAPLLHLVGLVASSASGCRYCVAHTASKLHDCGANKEKIANVWSYETNPLFDEPERAALRFAHAAGQAPSAVTEDHFGELRRFYTDREIVEMLFVICQFGFWNRWNDSVGTTLESSPRTFAEDVLPEEHWSIGKHASS